MQWQDDHATGITEIDEQLKGLIQRLEELEAAIRQGKEWSTVHFSILDLKEQARFHFTCEEALMRMFGYAELKLHAAEHAHFLKVLSEIENHSILKSVDTDSTKLLLIWMTKHILGSDQDFGRYILSGGRVVKSEPIGA